MGSLVRNLKNPNAIPTSKLSMYTLVFRSLSTFRSFESATFESEDGVVDHQEFVKWGNGGGLFHKSASIDPTTVVEVGAIIHPRASLGSNVHVGSGAVVGPSVTIGNSSILGTGKANLSPKTHSNLDCCGLKYNVTLSNCSIGDSCVIHNGVCVGQDGFGFFIDEAGNMTKKPQALSARIGNHVEIGANTCIDRGSWRDTTIGDYTKIDNLVQIAHNVVIGRSCILCGQVGIAGSATIGDYVTFGGRAAVRDHVSIVSKVRLAGNSCVTKDIMQSGDYGGFPAVPIQQWRRQIAGRHLKSVSQHE